MGFHLIAAFLFLKKYALYTSYKAAKEYGFHRVYRRILEVINTANITNDKKNSIKRGIKNAIRFPDKAEEALADSAILEFIVVQSEKISKSSNIPPFMVSATTLIFRQTPFGSVYDALHALSKKKDKRKD